MRDAIDLKRMMILVVIAALPCVRDGALQHRAAGEPRARSGEASRRSPGWRHDVIRALGVGYSPDSIAACIVHGALYFLPLYIVTMVVGPRAGKCCSPSCARLEVNEGFFVTGILFPLILPPTTPLWQAALGISFGVVLAKEVFGGTGMNFINPALAARAFLFFAYPAEISGDKVWTAVPPGFAVDGFSGATLLAQMRQMTGAVRRPATIRGAKAFLGLEPGSMGETSALACLIGAAILIVTGIGSWRIDGRRGARHDRDVARVQRARDTGASLLRRAVLVAHGRRRLGVRHRVHGDRPGDLAVHRARQVDLRRADRRASSCSCAPSIPRIPSR